MKKNSKINKLSSTVFYLLMLLLSIGLFWLSSILVDTFWKNLISNFSTGIIGAVIVAFFFEKMDKKRQKKYIEKILESNSLTLIRERIPTPLYSVIEKFIIEQPCIPYNCEGIIELSLIGPNYDKVVMHDRFEYIVENTQAYDTEYELYIFEDDLFLYEDYQSKINRLVVENYLTLDGDIITDDESAINKFNLGSYSWEELKSNNWIEENVEKTVISFRQKLLLKPHQKIRVSVSIQSVREIRDFYPYIMTEPTRDLKLSIIFPPSLELSTFRLHPSTSSFKTTIDFENQITTRIDTGILPYQGIQLYWRPKNLPVIAELNNIESVDNLGVEQPIKDILVQNESTSQNTFIQSSLVNDLKETTTSV